jgi:hypothetical protein
MASPVRPSIRTTYRSSRPPNDRAAPELLTMGARRLPHTYRMSVVQACAEAEAAIQRARSLFASQPEPPATGAANAAGAVQNAAQTTTTAGQATSDMSGAFITTHKAFVDESAPKLSAASQTDTTLQAHTAAAATLTQAGAQRLDTIAAQTRETSQAAATVSTPAGEKAVLVALRSQLARANDVVSTTQTAGGRTSRAGPLPQIPPSQQRPR